jgi:hypothetical protein
MLSTALSTSAFIELDYILADVARQLQLTKTQYEEADRHYRAVTAPVGRRHARVDLQRNSRDALIAFMREFERRNG